MPLHVTGREVTDVHAADGVLHGIWVRGQRVWPTVIEDFEDGDNVSDHLRGSDTGSAWITSDAALVPERGSTQGLRFDGFNERYALPGDHDTPLESGRDASYYFRPRNLSDSQFHFILAPQESEASPPDACYRFEMHMDTGPRLVKMPGREVLDTYNTIDWSDTRYKVDFRADSSGVQFTVAGVTLSTSDTEYVDAEMGFGFRASGGGSCDYDWVGY